MRTIVTDDGKTTITSPYMNLTQAALYCGCSDTELTQAMADRAVTYIQVHQSLVFKEDDLDAYMKNHEVLDRFNYLDAPPDDDAPDRR